MTIYGTGIRLSETVNLRVKDIDFSRKLIHIHQGKGKKDRVAPLADKLALNLRVYLRMPSPEEYLFEGHSGGQYSTRSVQSIL
jgi:integrase